MFTINKKSAISAASYTGLFTVVWLVLAVTASFLPWYVTLVACFTYLGWLGVDQYQALERRRVSYDAAFAGSGVGTVSIVSEGEFSPPPGPEWMHVGSVPPSEPEGVQKLDPSLIHIPGQRPQQV